MEGYKREERRRHPRVKVRIEVSFQKMDSYLHRFTENISEGGCFIETDEVLPPRTEVPLEFSFPNHDKPVEIIGEVVWVLEGSHSGMGIQYKKISPNARKVLREIVQSRVEGDQKSLTKGSIFCRVGFQFGRRRGVVHEQEQLSLQGI